MPTYTLTILDTVGIQKYIFGSNRLKENVGASALVQYATEKWVYEALPELHNVIGKPGNGKRGLDNAIKIEDGQLHAEVMYTGGGNTVILFRDRDIAKGFVTALSKKLIAYAPGLELAVIHKEFNWQDKALGGEKGGEMADAFKELADIKRSHSTNRPLAGMGVTAFCQSTGLPATAIDADSQRLISAEVSAKLRAEETVSQKLGGVLSDAGYEMIRDFDGIGSYLAVVHADGNRMGKKLEAIAKNFSHPSQNREYIEAMRAFSGDVQAATITAVEKMEELLVKSVDTSTEKINDIVPVPNKKLPYRQLISGGDDFTFVCDGRLALTLTAFYLQTFEQEITKNGKPYLENTHACAGIAVVKSHYPFARAYELAEALCKSAKDWVKDDLHFEQGFSAMDWHFAPSGLMGELDFIRKREYQLSDKKAAKTLLMRPIAVGNREISWRNWENFVEVVSQFVKKNGKDGWANKRNKAKRLREALRAGPEAVEQFLGAYKTSLPPVVSPHANLQTTGWGGDGYCAYFDAIEAMDFYVSLCEDERNRP